MQGHKSQVLVMAFSPGSTRAITASKDGTYKLWSLDVRYQLNEDAKCLYTRDQQVVVVHAAFWCDQGRRSVYVVAMNRNDDSSRVQAAAYAAHSVTCCPCTAAFLTCLAAE